MPLGFGWREEGSKCGITVFVEFDYIFASVGLSGAGPRMNPGVGDCFCAD